jgi:hypothetical protein
MKRPNYPQLPLHLLGGIALLMALLLASPMARAATTILQSAGSTAIAWEAENPGTYINDPLMVTTPSPAEIWTPTNDATASGGKALYALGQNITAFPASYVDYRLQFATPGSYRLYLRARADVVWAAADRFTANSLWIPLRFNTPFTSTTLESEAHYVRSAMNASDAQATPSSTNFNIYGESPLFEVTQAMVDSREVVTLRVGTRERGVMLDRLVQHQSGPRRNRVQFHPQLRRGYLRATGFRHAHCLRGGEPQRHLDQRQGVSKGSCKGPVLQGCKGSPISVSGQVAKRSPAASFFFS